MQSGTENSNTPEETQPAPAVLQTPDQEESSSPSEPKTRRRWPRYALIYLLVIVLVSAVAFWRGRSSNEAHQQEQVSQFLQEQFELGLQDLEKGNFELARQRFEAIIRYDPVYPGAEEKLIEIFVALDVPTITPTAIPSPTPDPSPPDQLFEQAEAALAEGDWTTTINKLLTLRAKDPSYRAVEADGLMYVALRSRGMELIAQGLMEEGLYDLSLAERFGLLDRDALFRKSLAQQYLLANSYIGLNWFKAADLFSSLCEQGATIDSCPKYSESAWEYGNQLIKVEDPCAALEYYEGSLSVWENEDHIPTATQAAELCAIATRPPPRPPEATETPTPEGGATEEPPPEEPTPEPTPTPTPETPKAPSEE
jgi:tetratricopeptide (TPR) repeat protein